MNLHGISTGLLSTTMRSDLEPYLDNPRAPGEVLLEKVTVSASLWRISEVRNYVGSKGKVTSNLICEGTGELDHRDEGRTESSSNQLIM